MLMWSFVELQLQMAELTTVGKDKKLSNSGKGLNLVRILFSCQLSTE